MKSLQEITDAWGNWKANAAGTACFTSSTNYADHSEFDAYHQYECSAVYQSISYDGNSSPTSVADVAYEIWYDNGSALQQSDTFEYAVTTDQSFTWSITEGVNVGVEISATESVPDVASSTQKATVALSFSSVQDQTLTKTQTWSVDTPVAVPPRSSLKCDMVVNSQSYEIKFTATVLVSGDIAVCFNDRVCLGAPGEGHFNWYIPITQVFNDVIKNNLIDTTGYHVTPAGVITTAQGVFSGGQGISQGVVTTQYPLRSSTAAVNFKGVASQPLYLNVLAIPAPQKAGPSPPKASTVRPKAVPAPAEASTVPPEASLARPPAVPAAQPTRSTGQNGKPRRGPASAGTAKPRGRRRPSAEVPPAPRARKGARST
jgi:Clostridium epsilon toxin ETX/Bacillus mosquitocidal toxin MTX2